MKKVLTIDASGIRDALVVSAVIWLTDKIRSEIVKDDVLIVRVNIFNALSSKFKDEVLRRINHVRAYSEDVAAEIASSLIHDAIKANLWYDSYLRLENNLFTIPFTTEDFESRYGEKRRDEYYEKSSDELFVDKNNIDKYIKEMNENEAEAEKYDRPYGKLEFRVRRILEQSIQPRLTSAFIETAALRAEFGTQIKNLSKLNEEVGGGKISQIQSQLSEMHSLLRQIAYGKDHG